MYEKLIIFQKNGLLMQNQGLGIYSDKICADTHLSKVQEYAQGNFCCCC